MYISRGTQLFKVPTVYASGEARMSKIVNTPAAKVTIVVTTASP